MIEIGELRAELSRDLQGVIMDILEKKSKDPNYFILVYSRAFNKDINTKVITMKAPPKQRLIGTMCFAVDNQLCQMRRLWNLPLDVPIDDALVASGAVNTDVAKSAKGLPIRT